MEQEAKFCNGRVVALVGDITEQDVDAVVNAANRMLLGGGGVDGAIHDDGGPAILAACKEIRRTQYPDGLPTGKAVITTAGDLPARFVIHTVGPIKSSNGERDADYLAASYRNSLALAVQQGLHSIAFPSISTGAFGYPKDEAAAVSSNAIEAFLRTDETIQEVRLVFFLLRDLQMFLQHHKFST